MLMPMLRPGGRRAGPNVLDHAEPVWLSLSRLTTGSAQFSCSMRKHTWTVSVWQC